MTILYHDKGKNRHSMHSFSFSAVDVPDISLGSIRPRKLVCFAFAIRCSSVQCIAVGQLRLGLTHVLGCM